MRNKFGLWLQEEREKRGFSQSELASRAGLNRSVINKIENNLSNPKPETLIAIAKGFDIPPSLIFKAIGWDQSTEYSPTIAEALHLLSMLEEEDIDEIIQIARMKLERKKATPTTVSRKIKPPAQTVLNGQ